MKKFVRPVVVYPRTASERAFLKELLRRSQVAHADLTRGEIEDIALAHMMRKANLKKRVSPRVLKAQLER